ncbi:MAG: hypothetical protein J5626_05035 [Lachnospiraceae bacterium]|nr:hypothetical protein [Lachnospiraceae bacterium]
MNYIAIIGDIKHSKDISNRYEIQERLKKTLDNINKRYKKDIAAKFLITLGDEFQGLLFAAEPLVDIIGFIQNEMFPVRIRIGVGIGEITTEINKNAAIGADGPAFYAARRAITGLHDTEKKLKNQAPDVQVEAEESEGLDLEQINTILSLLKVVENGWSESQRKTIWDMIENGGSQEDCAKRMNTTQSTVARRLSGGNFMVYNNSRKLLHEVTKRFDNR